MPQNMPVSFGVVNKRCRRRLHSIEVNIPRKSMFQNYDVCCVSLLPETAKSKARLLLNKVPRNFFSTNLKLKNRAGMAAGRHPTNITEFMRT